MSELNSVEFYPGKHSRLREKKIFCDACLPRGASKRELEARFHLFQTALADLDEIYESFLKSIIEPLEKFIATNIRDAYSGLTFNGVDNKTFMPFLYCQLDEDICIAVSFFVNLENYLSNYCSAVIRLNSVVHTQMADILEEIAKHLVTYLTEVTDDAVDPTTTLSVVLDIVEKKIQAGKRMKPTVIILEQSYRFDGEFLNDILKSCYAIFRKINILIICFNVHGISYFSDLLNPSVIEKLNIVQYSAIVSASALDDFMLSLFSSEKIVFFLKADAVKLLTRHVMSMDSSVANLVRTYRFCMLEHFRTQRCSTFCAPSAIFENTVLRLKETDLASLVADLKVSNFLPSKRSKSETALQSAIVGAGREFFNYKIAFFDALRCLHCLSACVPGHPFATTERQLLVMAQDEDFVHSNRWKQFFDWLPNVDRDILQSTVDKCKETILNNNRCERLQSLLDLLNNLENCWLEEEKQKKSRKGATSTNSQRNQAVVDNSLLSSQQLRKKLLHNYIETSTSNCSRINKWSQELSEQFADLLRHVSSLLFYQIAYGNSIEAIHTSIIPSVSKSIQESVLNLNDTDAATILRVLLDHQAENLSVKDWFNQCRPRSTAKSRSSKNIQACLSSFYRMLANLEYVGFIEPFTRRGEILMKEFIPNFADQQVRATLKKLVIFSLSIIVLPLGSMFFSKRFIFENLFGFDSSKSTTFSAILAIFIVHVVLILFIIAAFREESEQESKFEKKE
ncbi:Vacuolar ATPase assembly integral membrane protein VMA21 [Trichinella zimbabwensis]|uniref:Vacuolar ATPase assembly integral membrane protein VMA21 homolog n=1 Tax=Trichinella zimbabwensis TaxID=268475 RepID=A0A0V1H5L2_9BILA|nr:Vacuolar ATPase assembly integral membrane protein VMA21 [Trichinella zimbabwensis]